MNIENKLFPLGAASGLKITQALNEVIKQLEEAKLVAWRIRQPETSYARGNQAIVLGANNFDKMLLCITPGITNAGIFPENYERLAIGDTVTDGTVVWQVIANSGGGSAGGVIAFGMQTITDNTSTAVTIAEVEENKHYVYTQPLTALTVESVPDSEQEAEIQFTAGTDITVSLPADVGIMPTGGVVFAAGASYIINFRNKLAVIASYTPGGMI